MRPGITWVIIGAVVIIGVLAGLDALRSSDGEPPPAEANAAGVKTMQDSDGSSGSASLIDEQLVRLRPGPVRTDTDYPQFDTFTVPPGWHGLQRGGGYVIGNEPNGRGLAWESGGISVEPTANRFSRSLADAARAFEKLRGIRIEHAVDFRLYIGGNSGRKYDLVVDKSVARPLGAETILRRGRRDVILLDVPGGDTNTLIIQWGFDGDQERAEVEGVLFSLETHRPAPPREEIERLGNGWARLFGAGRRCNRFMSQPVCEQVDCVRVGGEQIENCTPISSEVQRSFAGAVVRKIVFRVGLAAARFSNGETVRFTVAPGGPAWSIDRVGAGGKLFADQGG